MTHLDALDTAILRELQADARRTNRDIATAVGVAPTTALDRTRGLRERGVIRGALLDIDLAKIGRPVQAMIAVRIRPPKRSVIEAFRDWAAALPETFSCTSRWPTTRACTASLSTASPSGPKSPMSAPASSTSTSKIPASSPQPRHATADPGTPGQRPPQGRLVARDPSHWERSRNP
jgi:DNA-binding Lrp family transcriptional regulator